MADPFTPRLWLGRAAFLAVACLIFFLRLLPLDLAPGGLPAPDLLLAVTVAWVLRRPAQVPPLLIVLVFLTGDMLFLRPPGLWTLLVLLATEFLRNRSAASRDMPLLAEWVLVGALMIGIKAAEGLLLMIFVVPQPSLALTSAYMLATLVAYPAVVVTLRYGLGLRQVAPGEVYGSGRRL